MASRNFKPCSGCDTPRSTNREPRCYEERQLIHIVTDFMMGTPVVITRIHSKDTKHIGHYLDYSRKTRTVHFQPFGDTNVEEIPLSDICTIKYRA